MKKKPREQFCLISQDRIKTNGKTNKQKTEEEEERPGWRVGKGKLGERGLWSCSRSG